MSKTLTIIIIKVCMEYWLNLKVTVQLFAASRTQVFFKAVSFSEKFVNPTSIFKTRQDLKTYAIPYFSSISSPSLPHQDISLM